MKIKLNSSILVISLRNLFSLILVISSILFSSCKDKREQAITQASSIDQELDPKIKLSLAQWSLHRTIKGGQMDNLEFAQAAADMGFEGVEYVNQFFKDKAQDIAYLGKMKAAAEKAGVTNLLIMIDGEGHLADADEQKRKEAIVQHKKWVDAAQFLGCHSIRVNAHGEGNREDVAAAAVNGLSELASYAKTKGINVLVENHGGLSSDGSWLADVMKKIDMANVGTLPDFGNFCMEREGGEMWGTPCIKEYDRYQGVSELMPYALAVSAKSHDFDEEGNETATDYSRMMQIIIDAGYEGFVGVEYEGDKLGEKEGIIKTKKLIEQTIN